MTPGLNGHDHVAPNRLHRWERRTAPEDYEERERGLELGRHNRLRFPDPATDAERLMVTFTAVLLAILVALIALQVSLGP